MNRKTIESTSKSPEAALEEPSLRWRPADPNPFWGGAVDVVTTVQYLSRTLSKEETEYFQALLSHNPDARDDLLEISSTLQQIQGMPLFEVVRLRSEKSLGGEVAAAWIDVGIKTLGALSKLRFTGAKVALSDLIQIIQQKVGQAADFRMLLQPRPLATIRPAFHRGSEVEGLKLEGKLHENGELTVRVAVPPEQQARWEGKTVEVIMRVDIPLVVGAGELHEGLLELQVDAAGLLLDRPAGPLGPNELSVATPADIAASLEVPPYGEDNGMFEHPRLEEPLTLEEGLIKAALLVPSPLRTSFDGKTMGIFIGLADGHWQRLLDLKLSQGQERYELSAEWPDATRPSFRLAVGLRYLVDNGAINRGST